MKPGTRVRLRCMSEAALSRGQNLLRLLYLPLHDSDNKIPDKDHNVPDYPQINKEVGKVFNEIRAEHHQRRFYQKK